MCSSFSLAIILNKHSLLFVDSKTKNSIKNDNRLGINTMKIFLTTPITLLSLMFLLFKNYLGPFKNVLKCFSVLWHVLYTIITHHYCQRLECFNGFWNIILVSH